MQNNEHTNGIPNVFVQPNVQPHHGTNGNGAVPDQPKPAENVKVQIAIKKHLFQGVPGGPKKECMWPRDNESDED